MSAQPRNIQYAGRSLQAINEKRLNYLLLDRFDRYQEISRLQKLNNDDISMSDAQKNALKTTFSAFAKEMENYRKVLHPQWVSIGKTPGFKYTGHQIHDTYVRELLVKAMLDDNKEYVKRLSQLKLKWDHSPPAPNSKLEMLEGNSNDYQDLRTSLPKSQLAWTDFAAGVKNFNQWLSKSDIIDQVTNPGLVTNGYSAWSDWGAMSRHWKSVGGNFVVTDTPWFPSGVSPWTTYWFLLNIRVRCSSTWDNLYAALEEYSFCFTKPLERLIKLCEDFHQMATSKIFTTDLKLCLDNICKEFALINDWYDAWPKPSNPENTVVAPQSDTMSTNLYRAPGSMSPLKQNNRMLFKRRVAFWNRFPQKPQVLHGINLVDLQKDQNLRFFASLLDYDEESAELEIQTWDNSDIFQASVTWLACYANDSRFLYDRVDKDLGSPSTASVMERQVFDVSFRRPFSQKPQVVIWIEGMDIDTGSKQNPTSDFWMLWPEIVPESITQTGFKVRLKDDNYSKTWVFGAKVRYLAIDPNAPGVACGTYTQDLSSVDQAAVSFKANKNFSLPKDKFKPNASISHFVAVTGFVAKKSSNLRFYVKSESATPQQLAVHHGFIGGSGLQQLSYMWFAVDNQVVRSS